MGTIFGKELKRIFRQAFLLGFKLGFVTETLFSQNVFWEVSGFRHLIEFRPIKLKTLPNQTFF